LKNIFQLVYVSRAYENLCYSDIERILESSRTNNRKSDLTGLLVYKDEHFLQILEGEQSKVMETFSRIIKDKRGFQARVLTESYADSRIFNRWPMAFHDADIDPNMNALMNDLFSTAFSRGKKEKKIILEILGAFRQGSCHFQES
jgi:hypothetical protein